MKGFLRPADLNVNILQDPLWYRIDLLPEHMKQEVEEKYRKHIEWLRPRDPLTRAVTGFESALNFLRSGDKKQFIPAFIKKTEQLDQIRDEKTVDVFPELEPIFNVSKT